MGANLILPAGSAAAASTPADPVVRSLRFDGSSYLSRVTGSTSTTWTISMWVKRGTLAHSDNQYLAAWNTSEGVGFRGTGDTGHEDKLSLYNGSGHNRSTGVYRDPSAWAHICISVNSGTGTVYYNGESIISGVSGIGAWGTLRIGDWASGTVSAEYFGVIADVYGIEGSALDHTSFTESNDYGGLKPKEYTGSFGTNGFHLKFEDSSDIGADDAGSNDFNTVGLASADIRTDVPTDSFCVMSPVDKGSGVTLSEGNLKAVCDNDWDNVRGTLGATSGKFYYEVVGNIAHSTRWNAGVDINQKCQVDTYNSNTGSIVYSLYDGRIYDGAGSYSSATQDQSETNARIGVAVDIDAGKVWFRFNNGSWELSGGDPTSESSSGSVTFTANSLVQPLFAGYGATFTAYFQESEWTDTAPTDYGEWKTSRLAAPTVTPSENFGIALWNGNSDSNPITGLGFQPDLLWTKSRSASGSSPKWFDSLRGVTKRLETNTAGSETTQSTELTSFDSDGFTLGSGSGSNYSGRTYAGWNWKAHQTPPTPTSYSTTLTLTVDDDYGGTDSTGWGTTELEVFEGTQSLGTVGQPTYDSIQGDAETVYEIKTNDASKIKIVWKTVDTSSDGNGSDRFSNIEVVLTDSSSNELASWYPSDYYGGGGEGPDAPEAGDVFRAQTSSANESTTGTLGVQQPTVESNSEKYNAAAGFTMFTYTGNSSTNNDTMLFNHSLGVPIDFAIGKCRSTPASGTSGGKWVVWHKDLSQDYYSLYLNETESENDVGSSNYDSSTGSSAGWFANASTGSQHHVKIRNVEIYDGSNTDTVRMVDNSKDFVFYGWASVEGYSKFGSYTGNADDDGPVVYTGFRPRYLMIKNVTTSATNYGWYTVDSAREPANEMADFLMANSSAAEGTAASNKVDFLSNGFKIRGDGNVTNQNNQTMVYIAFAESPFKHANAR